MYPVNLVKDPIWTQVSVGREKNLLSFDPFRVFCRGFALPVFNFLFAVKAAAYPKFGSANFLLEKCRTRSGTDLQVVDISQAQMAALCGNVLELEDGRGLPVLAMSSQASLLQSQTLS